MNAVAIKARYHTAPENQRAAFRRHYYVKQKMLLAQYRARFALKEPNSSTKKYISRLKSKLIGNAKIQTSLKQAFKNKHHLIAQKMSESVLVTSACRLAACQVYAQVVGMRKRRVGLMIRAIRYINVMAISPNNLGVQHHLSRTSMTLHIYRLIDALPCQMMSMAAASVQKN